MLNRSQCFKAPLTVFTFIRNYLERYGACSVLSLLLFWTESATEIHVHPTESNEMNGIFFQKFIEFQPVKVNFCLTIGLPREMYFLVTNLDL